MSNTQTDTQVLVLAIEDNQGYSPRQAVQRAGQAMTLGELLLLVEQAVDAYGEDAVLVTDNGDRYGARYGVIDTYRDTFVPATDEDDEA